LRIEGRQRVRCRFTFEQVSTVFIVGFKAAENREQRTILMRREMLCFCERKERAKYVVGNTDWLQQSVTARGAAAAKATSPPMTAAKLKARMMKVEYQSAVDRSGGYDD
jgi:hypothetical protein